jgi:hypothetical protein
VVRDCTAALQLAPRNLKAFLRRGLAHEFLEKYDDAAADFKHAMAGARGGGVHTRADYTYSEANFRKSSRERLAARARIEAKT